MGELGQVSAPERTGPVVTALQVIADDERVHARINRSIRGVFWALVLPDWVQVGFELPVGERDHASHLTVLEAGGGAALASFIWSTIAFSLR